nr:centrosomal protein of 295 kDa isoform X2 [Misgurnus anguillicaudatus]
MKRKTSKVSRLRLSPNEEAQLVKEELDRRRKLRLQQVREQQRYIAQQVRREVQERREKQLQIIADTLQDEWQQERSDKLQIIARAYEDSLQSVGNAHRSAQENQPDLEALAQRSVERQERAADRQREALRELTARRHEEEEQRQRHIEARRKALLEEKKRASRVASLPPPPPNPLESIGVKSCPPLKTGPAERFFVTHHHMSETAVDRETDTQQMDARQAAEEEFQRLEEVKRLETRDRQEKLEKARLRGNHALRNEQHTQDHARLLCELERLQQADLLRRRQAVNRIPAQIFQPLYRQQEIRDEQQRDLEIAFHDMYTEERKVRGDLELQLVPEPLPHSSAGSHDEDLDVTVDPEGEEPDTVNETLESSVPSRDPGRQALRKMLDRIRNQRDRVQEQQTVVEETSSEDVVTDVSSIETGSLNSQEREQAVSVEEQTSSVTESEEGPEVSNEPIVAGMIPMPEEDAHVTPVSAESERRTQQTDEVTLLRQQREQLLLLEEIEEKRRELEQRLKDAQQARQTLEDAAQMHSGIEEAKTLPEPTPEVTVGDTHTERLRQYQQRLLEQDRRHKKCVEDARRRLEEYQHTLRLRSTIGIDTSQTTSVCPLRLPNIIIPDHQSVLAHPGDIIGPEKKHERGDMPIQLQGTLFSPSKPVSSDTTNPSVMQSGREVSVQCPEVDHAEETSPDSCVEDQLCVSEHEQVPLPPPSVILELLRSRQQRAVVKSAEVCNPVMPLSHPSSAVQTPAQPEMLQREAEPDQSSVETDRQHVVRQHLRRTDMQGLHTDHLSLMNTLLKAIEETSGHTKPSAAQSNTTTTPTLLNDSTYEHAPVNRGKAKPPVTRPPARLAFLQQMEAHELSAIQEVDTPVNISLDAGDLSESSSASLPAVISDGSRSESDGSRVTGRISRMSWREALMIDSATSQTSGSSINQQPEFEVDVPPGQSPVDPDCLSSTTISTGSYSTSEHEPNCTIIDTSLSRIEPVGTESSVSGTSPKSSSYHLTSGNQLHEMRDSIQQIIDKYTKDLDTSLRTGSVHTGGNTSSVSHTWSSILQQSETHDEAHTSSLNSAVHLSNTELTGDFLPLQPHPDIDSSSSSSSSSRNVERDYQSSRMQGWNETVSKIVERFSNQLSIRRADQGQVSPLNQLIGERVSNTSHLFGHITKESSQSSSVMSVQQNSVDPQSSISESSHNAASPQANKSNDSNSGIDGQAGSHGQFGLSRLIGRASDIDSSQVLDDSSAAADGLREMTRNTGGGRPRDCEAGPLVHPSALEIISPVQQRSVEDGNAFTDGPHDDTSDCFLSLPTEVTHNESMERSLAAQIPLEAEICRTNLSIHPPDTSAFDWLEPTDASLASFGLDSSSHHQFRADTQIQSKSDLQISMDQLCFTHESLCETDIVAPPTSTDVSRMKYSPPATPVQDESCELVPQDEGLKPHLISTETSQHQSIKDNTLDRLLERAQELGDGKGILEESTISFISIPESTTLQDPDTETEDYANKATEPSEEKEIQRKSDDDDSQSKVSVCADEDSSRTECPEISFFPQTVMMLEYQSSSAQQQEALLRRRHCLAQRSALRAAEVKAKRAEMRKVVQNVSKATSSSGYTVQKSEMVCRLKTVAEVKISTPGQKSLEDGEMYQRTQRLYKRLEEVKQKEEYYNRQKAYAKNREKAKEFQRKTLEKLRAKQKS